MGLTTPLRSLLASFGPDQAASAEDTAKKVDEDDDNLYYKAYAAGVLFVFLSLTFQGE